LVESLLSDKGGMGKTYLVRQNQTIKVLKVLYQDHPKAVTLFQQEAHILSQLNHVGIPRGDGYFTYFPKDSPKPIHCLVMEKIEGMDLEEYMEKRQFQPIAQDLAIAWLRQLVEILHIVHTRQFFHRDIKPSNIILQPSGNLALIDFGAVREVTATIIAGQANTGIFTPGFAPPEQQRGFAVPQSDFFALGKTIVYLLSGKTPNDPAVFDHYHNRTRWQEQLPQVRPALAELIDQMTAESVAQRPKNTEVIRQKLAQIDSSSSTASYQSSLPDTVVLPPPIQPSVPPASSSNYASFGQRWVASIIDGVIIAIVGFFLAILIAWYVAPDYVGTLYENLAEAVGAIAAGIGTGTSSIGLLVLLIFLFNLSDSENQLYFFTILVGAILNWGYWVFQNSSPAQATWGKSIIGLKISSSNSSSVSFGQANIRYWSKILSDLTIGIGYLIAINHPRKQTLHDRLAKTVVIKQ
jgi:serine/threonine protein kinase